MLLFDFTVTSFIFVTIAVKVDESTTVCFIVFVCVCVFVSEVMRVMWKKGGSEHGKTFREVFEQFRDLKILLGIRCFKEISVYIFSETVHDLRRSYVRF